MQEYSSGKVRAGDFASGEPLQQLVSAIFSDLETGGYVALQDLTLQQH
jgi:hypothetical protein